MKRLLTLLVLLPALCAANRSNSGGEIQSILNQRAAEVPGAAIAAAVVNGGRVTTYFAGSTGTARKLDTHTLFEVGSVTKTFTATALAALASRGTVNLSDPVSRFLPATVHVPSRNGKSITLLLLATQHSGLPRLPSNMVSANDSDPYAAYTESELYAFLNSYKLPRDPGAEYEYSNLGFGLLGLALTRAAHQTSYETLIEDNVFKPLHMTESEVALSLMPDLRMAIGHTIDGAPVHSWDFTNATAGLGAIRSNIHDMLSYLRCNLGHGPLASTCLNAQRPRDSFTGYQIGLAWWTSDRTGTVQHGGDTAGFHAMVMMNAAHTKGVVVLSSGPAIADVAAHLLDPSQPVAASGRTSKLWPAKLNEYAGTYRNEPAGITYEITQQNNRLYAQIVGQPAAQIYPSRWADHFYYKVVPASIEFVRHDGKTVGLILAQSGRHVPVYRIGRDGKPLTGDLTPAFPQTVVFDARTLQQYTGTYVLNGANVVITRFDSQLYVQIDQQPAVAIYPSAKDEFFYKAVDAQITFARNGARVTGFTLHQNGNDLPAQRI